MDYKKMNLQDLADRVVDAINTLDRSASDDMNLLTYTVIRSEAENYLKAKNKKKPGNKDIMRTVKNVYKKLMNQPNVNIDAQWVEIAVFNKQPTYVPPGVSGMYYRMQKVKEMHESFSKQAEKDEAENVQAQAQQATQQAAQQGGGDTQAP